MVSPAIVHIPLICFYLNKKFKSGGETGDRNQVYVSSNVVQTLDK